MRVAALFCNPNTHYRSIRDVDVYDATRCVSTFAEDCPIVAHPMCRAWSAWLRHQAKPKPGEMTMGLLACEWLKELGGVLEHPACSHLFAEAGLPKPGYRSGHLLTISVDQCWWGYPVRKRTWLCFSRCEPLDMPFRLHNFGDDARRYHNMSKLQRQATTPELAKWLVNCARQVYG